MSQTTIKLLHEAEGHVVSIETKTNEIYRGYLIDATDSMNCQLSDVTLTTASGETKDMKQVFLRGSKIRFMILPEILRNAPMFQVGKGAGMSGVVPPQNIRGGGRGFGSKTHVSDQQPQRSGGGAGGHRGGRGGGHRGGDDRPSKRRRFNH